MPGRSVVHLVVTAAVVTWLTACSGGEMGVTRTEDRSHGENPTEINQQVTAVAATRVYFGHQSVGANVLEGLRELGTSAGTRGPSILRTRDLGGVSGAALIEFPIGDNGDPSSKSRDFASVLDQSHAASPAIALFKYCYLDITPSTNVASLFAAHRDAVRALQARHPEITFVHVTAPLTSIEPTSKLLIKRLLGKPSSRDANRKRNEFNALVRREFAGEPLFDLAKAESSRPDGSRTFFADGGDTVYTLAPELTDDGGHLNAAGRRAAALELLSTLSQAISPNARDGGRS